MSTNDANKSKNSRACQSCRKKKGNKMCDAFDCFFIATYNAPGDVDEKFPRCTNCVQANVDCTFIRSSTRNFGQAKAYVDDLEKRAAAIEMHLRKLIPHADIDNLIATVDEVEEDEDAHFVPTYRKDFEKWTSYYGKSSGHALVHLLLDMSGIREDGEAAVKHKEAFVKYRLRTEFWNPRPWETLRIHQRPVYEFPPDDLMASLTQLYFANIHIFLPLLHKPTFERKIAEGEHLDVTSKFGTIVMLVMAVASRFSDDPRVLARGYDSSLSSGWEWFAPVRPVLYGFVDCYTQTTSLYDLQATCLSVMAASDSAMWSQLGIAIRAAQDIGAHRKKPKCKQGDPVTEELLKRAWWALVCMDTLISSSMGRACMILKEDFDIDLPVECDDEYWEHPDPAQAFQQPVDKPCQVSAFICFIQLTDMTATALRKLYCVNSMYNLFTSTTAEWEERNVASLDSAFNQWLDAVPQHIRWDPENPEPHILCTIGSDILFFLPPPNSRFIGHFFRNQGKGPDNLQHLWRSVRMQLGLAVILLISIIVALARQCLLCKFVNVFTAGIVLLLQMWAAKSVGLSVNLPDRMSDIQKCLDSLERVEKRWASAGRFRDILLGLVRLEENAPHNDTVSRNKRLLASHATIEPALPIDTPTEIPGAWPTITMDAETDQLLRILSETSSWYEPGDWYTPTCDTASVFPSSSESPLAPFPGEWTDPTRSIPIDWSAYLAQ
ncbi:fungal-specific transcription factor domain-containing protein [Mycena floridula]|nr:fungal-specific transcription factor domain-containing protein [Mycena floridula]